MKRDQKSLIWGIVLVCMGVMILLDRLGVIGSAAGVIWAGIFGAGGVAFTYTFVKDNNRWWAVIPGFSMLGLAVLIGVGSLAPWLADYVGAPAFLASIGLAFLTVYFTRRNYWWALIPGGVMLSVASLVFVDGLNPPFDSGGIILLGIGLTFAAVALTGKNAKHGRDWAYIPAGIMGVLGFMVLADSIISMRYLWPLLIVAAGGALVLRGLGRDKRGASKASVPMASSRPTPLTSEPVVPEETPEAVQPAGNGTNKLNEPWN